MAAARLVDGAAAAHARFLAGAAAAALAGGAQQARLAGGAVRALLALALRFAALQGGADAARPSPRHLCQLLSTAYSAATKLPSDQRASCASRLNSILNAGQHLNNMGFLTRRRRSPPTEGHINTTCQLPPGAHGGFAGSVMPHAACPRLAAVLALTEKL